MSCRLIETPDTTFISVGHRTPFTISFPGFCTTKRKFHEVLLNVHKTASYSQSSSPKFTLQYPTIGKLFVRCTDLVTHLFTSCLVRHILYIYPSICRPDHRINTNYLVYWEPRLLTTLGTPLSLPLVELPTSEPLVSRASLMRQTNTWDQAMMRRLSPRDLRPATGHTLDGSCENKVSMNELWCAL